MSRGRPVGSEAFPKLMERIGVKVPDTEFNRRAAAYAATANNAERMASRNAGLREKKTAPDPDDA